MKTKLLFLVSALTACVVVSTLVAIHQHETLRDRGAVTLSATPDSQMTDSGAIAPAAADATFAFARTADDRMPSGAMRPLLAQYAVSGPAAAADKPPFYADPSFIGWALGTVSAIVAVITKRDATRKSKALNAVIVGVERATELPQVQAAASHIKEEIQRFAVANGVEDHLYEIVQRLTAALPQSPAPADKPAAV